MLSRSAGIGVALLCLNTTCVWAGSAAVRFNLPAMELCAALIEFHKQSHVTLWTLLSDNECHLKTQTVVGVLTPQAALEKMLATIPFVVSPDRDGTLVIKNSKLVYRLPSSELPGTRDGKGPTDSSQVVVTGSYLRRSVASGASGAVIFLTRDDLVGAGYATVLDAVYALPLNSLNAPREDYLVGRKNYQFGSAINLRGLGVGATLVLVNGRRQPASGLNGDFVDVSNIPLSAVDRIEILPDGASASYGSDAIAGVVNIILHDQMSGAETQAQTSSTLSGRTQARVSQTVGTHLNVGSAFLAYEYLEATPLAASQRAYAADADKRPFGGGNYRSFYSNPGNLLDPITLLPVYGIPSAHNGVTLPPNALSPTINLENPFTGYQIFPARASHSLYATLSQEVSDDLQLFAEARVTQRHAAASKSAAQQILTVPRTNPFDPFPELPYTLVAYNFLRDLGPNTFSAETRDYVGTVGARFNFLAAWRLSLSTTLGRDTLRSDESNVPDPMRLEAALASVSPVGAFNPFGDGTNTSQSVLDSIRQAIVLRSANTLDTTSLIADGPLFCAPAGVVKLAVGVEQDQEALRHDIPNPGSPASTLSERYSRGIRAVFAELGVPLIGHADEPLAAPTVHANLASRFVNYSDFGHAFSPSARLRWMPIDSILLRASWTGSFRAPPLDALYDSSQNAAYATTLADPQSPTGRSSVLVLQGTNPTLRPETATTWTGGLDLAPSILTGLRLSWTYYSIAYQGQIITPTLDDPADVLLHITRNPSGVLVDWICNSPEFNSSRAACLASSPTAIVDLRLANLGLTHMSGLDMNVREQLETRLGGFDLKALGSRVFSLTQSATSTSPTVDILDTVGNAISLRLRATAAWSQHIGNDTGFGAEVGVNYTGPYRNPASRLVPNVRSWTTFDLKLRYRTPSTGWWSGIELALTAVNLFDEPPPFVDDVYGYDVANVQPLGRVIGLNFSKRW